MSSDDEPFAQVALVPNDLKSSSCEDCTCNGKCDNGCLQIGSMLHCTGKCTKQHMDVATTASLELEQGLSEQQKQFLVKKRKDMQVCDVCVCEWPCRQDCDMLNKGCGKIMGDDYVTVCERCVCVMVDNCTDVCASRRANSIDEKTSTTMTISFSDLSSTATTLPSNMSSLERMAYTSSHHEKDQRIGDDDYDSSERSVEEL